MRLSAGRHSRKKEEKLFSLLKFVDNNILCKMILKFSIDNFFLNTYQD